MTHEEQMEEMQKCKESGVYFYNKYVKRPENPEITEEQMLFSEALHHPIIRKMRNPELFIENNFDKLPEYLKQWRERD